MTGSRNIAPRNAAEAVMMTRLQLRNSLFANSGRSSSGSAVRRSTTTSSVSIKTPPMPAPMMTGLSQPFEAPSLSAYMSEARPAPASTKPGTSKRLMTFSRVSWTNR
jgi:hypothetical protein